MLSRTPGRWSLWFSGCGWSARRQGDLHHSAFGWCPRCMASTPDHSPLDKFEKQCYNALWLKVSTYSRVTGSTEAETVFTLGLTLYTLHSKCHSAAHALYLATSQPILNVTLGVTVSLAVTHSYLKEALYLAGRKVFTESTQEQRTCVWLGTWQETLSSPGGSGKQEPDRFIYRKNRGFVFILRARVNVIF